MLPDYYDLCGKDGLGWGPRGWWSRHIDDDTWRVVLGSWDGTMEDDHQDTWMMRVGTSDNKEPIKLFVFAFFLYAGPIR